MNILLAHHLETHHFFILVSLFAAGYYIGWQMLSDRLARRNAKERLQP
jgi:hypothetical protein